MTMDKFAIYMNRQTINSKNILHAEAVAVLEVVRSAIALDLKKIFIEGDNLIIINALKKKWRTP